MSSGRWQLTALQFDLCWEIARHGEYPFPIAVSSYGETVGERAVVKQRLMPELQAAGLLNGETLEPGFALVLAQIARPGLWIEGLWMPDDVHPSPVRLMSIAFDRAAILVVQEPGEFDSYGGDLHISVHENTAIWDAALQGMPPVRPGRQPRLVVGVSDLAQATANSDSARTSDGDYSDQGPSESGPGSRSGWRANGQHYAEQFRELVDAPHFRDGQFTANRRDPMGMRHRSKVLKWFDAFEPDGRYGIVEQYRAGAGTELVLAPIDTLELRAALRSRVNDVRSR